MLSPLGALAVLGAGVAAGTINTVVGSGTLITFPTLLALGLPPVTANVSNTVGIFPGSLAGTWGYRAGLAGQGRRLVGPVLASTAGGLLGGLALLVLPVAAFRTIVPVLIGLACVLVLIGPRVNRWLADRRQAALTAPEAGPLAVAHHPTGLAAAVLGSGVYGGYFGAAQGVLLIAILGILYDEDLQRVNAAKNLLAAVVNLTAAALFVVVASVDWQAAGLVAAGSTIGGLLGARVGRRLPARVLRALVLVVGVVALSQML